jgi:hypothetical protein
MTKKRKVKKSKFHNQTETDKRFDKAYSAFDKILELTSRFCRENLNDEYLEVCEDLTWAVYEEGLPLDRGKPAGWASGIVHAVGYVNFLHDPSQSPHMTSSQLAQGFGVSQQTMQTKSKIIRDEFDMMPFDPEWCLPALLSENPLVWMLEVDGFIIDIRMAPREAQEEAYQLGLIPYIPADRPVPQPPANAETKIIQFPSGQNKTSDAQSAQKQKDDGPILFE